MNYKWALIIYCFLFLGLTTSFLLDGEVISPSNLSGAILARQDKTKLDRLENHKFSDAIHVYIPEIQSNINGKRSGWLSLWTNENESGRPVNHISGFSPAYLPSWVMMQFTSDPWRFFTALSLLTCFMAGLFMVLFCRETGLHPWAALISGISLATSPFLMYWLTFPMFLSTYCWTIGSMWALIRLTRKLNLTRWSVLSFCIYSLLMTGYPQLIVFHAYILVGYGLYLFLLQYRQSHSGSTLFIAYALSAIVIGFITTLPTYIDLWRVAQESGRMSPDPSFFTAALPKLGTFQENVQLFLLSTLPDLAGNPIAPNFRFPYNGISFTSLVIFFVIVSLVADFKRNWGWWLVIGIAGLLTFVHPIYRFAIQYLGFNLSRSTPLAATLLPVMIIAAHGINWFVRQTDSRKSAKCASFSCISMFTILFAGMAFVLSLSIEIHWEAVLSAFIVILLFVVQITQPRPVLLLIIVFIQIASISYPLMLKQNPGDIASNSPLIDKMRANLSSDAHFASVSPHIAALQPNLNSVFALSSIHSYNSLSSRRYQSLIAKLGGETQIYGRWNNAISPDYDGVDFWMSNIALILSPVAITHHNLSYAGEEPSIYLYQVISRMGNSLQILTPDPGKNGEVDVGDPRASTTYHPTKISDQADSLEFTVEPLSSQSIFVLSQQYHRDWEAKILTQKGWEDANCVIVNGAFEGVFIPPDSQRIRLEFKPFVRFAWIGNLFWLLLFLLAFLNQDLRKTAPAALLRLAGQTVLSAASRLAWTIFRIVIPAQAGIQWHDSAFNLRYIIQSVKCDKPENKTTCCATTVFRLKK